MKTVCTALANHSQLENMNPEVQDTFDQYRQTTDNPVVAAILTLADVLSTRPPEPIFVEPSDCSSYSVKEAATLMKRSSKEVYQMILTGTLHCFRAGNTIRIPSAEVDPLS